MDIAMCAPSQPIVFVCADTHPAGIKRKSLQFPPLPNPGETTLRIRAVVDASSLRNGAPAPAWDSFITVS